jgi:hypothetical protein
MPSKDTKRFNFIYGSPGDSKYYIYAENQNYLQNKRFN